MIAIAADCLIFELATGERIPYLPDMLSVELAGGAIELFDSEFVRDATEAVFHYFKHELGRQAVSISEFGEALEKVLRGFALSAQRAAPPETDQQAFEVNLDSLALEVGQGRELFFFPRLRAELQRSLQRSPRRLRLRGLRGCVKRLAGAQRWSPRCRTLEAEIVDFLSECLRAESAPSEFALLVE